PREPENAIRAPRRFLVAVSLTVPTAGPFSCTIRPAPLIPAGAFFRVDGPTMRPASEPPPSPRKLQAADALRRARQLPIGPDRNDLRQLAVGLLWMEKKGLDA